MQTAVNTTITALVAIVQSVGIGTNVSLLRLLWVMVNGSFLGSRGAVHSALAANAFSDEEVRRSWAALRYGQWEIDELLTNWQIHVAATNGWRVRRHRGYRVKSVDITGFFRSRLQGAVSQHYAGLAQRALPAMVFGVMITSGQIQEKRVPLLEKIVRCEAGTSESTFRGELLQAAAKEADPDEITVLDAGFHLPEIHLAELERYVVRMAANCTARQNRLPEYKGRGARPKYGALIRPLARKHKGRTIAASQAQQQGRFAYKGRTIRYHIWPQLVTVNTKVDEDNPTFTLMLFFDPLYKKPMILATDLPLDAEAIYHIYRDRWPVEHPPLAAKQMIGLHRQFVFAEDSCFRLPELALLAGNVLTHCAALLPPVPSGFWDRAPKATPGRLRRLLNQAIFPNVLELDPELRKKNSVSDHLPKGIHAHRRQRTAA
ncbi:MAG: hypothetical protein R3A44_38960 [Caldilineaceae bacterium]